MIPPYPIAALEVRFWDRFFNNYIATPQQTIVRDAAWEKRPATGSAN